MKSEDILSPASCFWFLSAVLVATALPTNQSFGVNRHRFPIIPKSSSSDFNSLCVHNEALYLEGQNFTTNDPCETCVCDPPEVRCKIQTCETRPGCKTIHMAGNCCPESVCECEKNGRMYSNGEKVEGPDPCKACYCKGGEIKCALVTCYSRNDCQAVYVEGLCCPKYEDCPPLETKNNKSAKPTPVVISDLSSESDDFLKAEESTKLEVTVAVRPSVPTLEIEEITGTHVFEISQVEDLGENATTTASESGNLTDFGWETSNRSEGKLYDPHHVAILTGEKFNLPLNANPLAKGFQSVIEDWFAEQNNSTEPQNISLETITRHQEVEATASADPNNATLGQAVEEVENYTETSRGEGLTVFENSTLSDTSSKASEHLQIGPLRAPALETTTSDLSSTSPDEDLAGTFPSSSLPEDSSAPGLKMLSSEQMEFLQVGEESPVYVDGPRPPPTDASTPDVVVVVVVPSVTPITVKMMKVPGINDSTKVSP